MLALLTLLACAPGAQDTRSTLPLQRCHLPGLDAETACGTLDVPEDPAEPGGRQIPLNIAVIKAVSPNPRTDPLFFLAGGPGQAATEVAPAVYRWLQRVQLHRDLVFVDQRGTGTSNGLRCDHDPPELADLLREESPDEALAEVVECRDGLDADLRFYGTHLAMDDLDAVREALGYDQISLYGGSYGTRAGLTYARRHPDRLRRMILDGLAPPTMPIFAWFGPDAQRALDFLVADCSTDPACSESFDVAADLERIRTTLPAETSLPEPTTGLVQAIEVTPEGFVSQLRGLLYDPTVASQLPYALHQAADGDWRTFATLSKMLSGSGEGMYSGMMLSVACAEDVDRIDDALLQRVMDGNFIGDTVLRPVRQACEIWPRGELPPDAAAPVSTDHAALLLSGNLDPVTPPRWGEEAAATLPNGRHVVVPGAGHITAGTGCVPARIAEFLESEDPATVDMSCVDSLERPPFVLDFAGPRQ